MSTVLDLLGSSRLLPSPGREQQKHDLMEPMSHLIGDDHISDDELETWVLGGRNPQITTRSVGGNQLANPDSPRQATDTPVVADNNEYRSRAQQRLGPTQHAEDLSVALVEAALQSTREDLLVAETEAVLRKVRSVQIEQLCDAILLLEEEQRLRKRRCNVLSDELRKLDEKKESIITGYMDGVVGDVVAVGDGADSHASSIGRRQAPEIVFSYDFTRSMATRRAGVPPRKAQQASPAAIPVACGPLTKRDVESHFQRYWESQRHRRLAAEGRQAALRTL